MSSRSAWCRCCKLSSNSWCWARSSSSFRTWRWQERGRWAPCTTWGSLPALEGRPSRHSLAPPARGASVLHLGLQLCQPGLTLQKVSLELSRAALQLHLCGHELPPVFWARRQAPRQGLREQGL